MVKITKTYTRRNGAYRRFYRRYTRKVSRKMYNRLNLNYMKAKILFRLSFMPDNQKKYGFKSQEDGVGIENNNVDIMDYVNKLPDYKMYMAMFNEVKLLGVGITCIPYMPANCENTNPILFACTYKEDGISPTPNYIYPSQVSIVKRYFKNFDRKWVPANQSNAVINQGHDMDFWLASAAQGTGNLNNLPRWTLLVTCYMQFRKNLTL